jgi:hypothetical protein
MKGWPPRYDQGSQVQLHQNVLVSDSVQYIIESQPEQAGLKCGAVAVLLCVHPFHVVRHVIACLHGKSVSFVFCSFGLEMLCSWDEQQSFGIGARTAASFGLRLSWGGVNGKPGRAVLSRTAWHPDSSS